MHDDIVELLNDPDFVTEFTLGISTGVRHNDGRFINEVSLHYKKGVIQPANSKDTQYLIDGDKHRQTIKVYAGEYLSPVDKRVPQLGDTICWHCNDYRVVNVDDWSQYGYWKAIAVQLLDKEHE